MESIAVTVQACLDAGTRVDVAWVLAADGVGPRPPAEAVAFTPGGGRSGSILDGALDERLADTARSAGPGRLVTFEIGHVDALITGLPADARVTCLVAPGTALPPELWGLLAARRPVAIVTRFVDGSLAEAAVYTDDTIDAADADVQATFDRHASAVTQLDEQRFVTVLWPDPQFVLAGQGDYAESIAELATWLGWHVERVADTVTAAAKAGALGPSDAAVVVGHDYETTGAVLFAALAGDAGYVAALGAPRVRRLRANWLSERGRTDLSRLRMPAGLDIGSQSPREVALAVLAEAHAVRTGTSARPLIDTPAPHVPGGRAD